MLSRFGDCELSLDRLELRRGNVVVPVEPQVFDVLTYLLRHRHRVVPKTELLDEVWGSRFVTESTLTSRVKLARRAVGDTGRDQRVIKTIHGRGYRFVAEVTEREHEPQPARLADSDKARLLGAVGDLSQGTGAVLRVAGPGGTDLLAVAADEARRSGFLVGASTADPGTGRSRIADALCEWTEQRANLLDGLPAGCRDELEALLDGRPPSTRQNVFVALRELLASAADGGGAVLLLDEPDLDDLATGLALEEAARLVPRHPLLVVTRGAPAGVPETAGDGDGDDDPAQAAERLIAAGRPEEAVATVLEASYAAMEAGDQEHVLRWTDAVSGRTHPGPTSVSSFSPCARTPLRRWGTRGGRCLPACSGRGAPGARQACARGWPGPRCSPATSPRPKRRWPDWRPPAAPTTPPSCWPGDAGLPLRRPGRRGGGSGGARPMALRPGAPDRLLDVITLQGMIAHNRAEWSDRLRRELGDQRERGARLATVFDSHLCVAEYLLYGPTPYDEVVALADQLRDQAERAGARRGVAFAASVAGEAALLAGDLDVARARLNEAVDLHMTMGADTGTAHALQRPAEVELAAGDRVG